VLGHEGDFIFEVPISSQILNRVVLHELQHLLVGYLLSGFLGLHLIEHVSHEGVVEAIVELHLLELTVYLVITDELYKVSFL